MERRDIVIIGGGPAGYTAAIRVSQLGGKPTLIENRDIGGTCLNRGCIPTRALSRAVELMALAKSAKEFGINYKEPEIDFSRIIDRKDTIVKLVVSGVKMLLDGNKVETLNGAAEFLSPLELLVKLNDGTRKEIKASKVIIASGSRSKKSSIPDGLAEKVIDTAQALELKEVPKSMLIIGGGPIGLSFATIFSRLGASVSVMEESPQILAGIDKEIVATLEKELKKDKVQIYTGSRFDGKEPTMAAGYILTVEQEANTYGLALDKIKLLLNEKGGIDVNRQMETNLPGVLAAGDVTMQNMSTPAAFAGGIVAAENAMGKNSEIDYTSIPIWANTSPEIAGIGITEDEANARGINVKIGRFPLAANAVATILGQRTGMVKVITEAKYGQILGVHIIGPQAANLIAEAALAIKLEATPENIGLTMHGHPTLAEVLWEAARDVRGETIHFMSQNR